MKQYALFCGAVTLSIAPAVSGQTVALGDRATAGIGAFGPQIAGHPYSADQVSEHTQTLSDGTHISQPQVVTHLYRDSQGRSRTERQFPVNPPGTPGPTVIEISDPVAGVRYTLDTRTKVARRFQIPTAAGRQGAPNGILFTPGNPAGRVVPVSPVPPPTGSQNQRPRPQTTQESMGTQMIEGVMAEGKRSTTTWPTGSVGNDRPIVTISENWFSPELNMMVLNKTSDPRNGESITKLSNISLAEPDPTLFMPPPDYTIEDGAPNVVH